MSDKYYRQCRMKREAKDGTFCELVSYIPEPYCVQGRVLKLKDYKGIWENGWVVTFASERRVADKDLPDPHKEIKDHWKKTGDVK